MGSPNVTGIVEISKSVEGVFIGGDPVGLRSLGELLFWLSEFDQEQDRSTPIGERFHVHLHPGKSSDFFDALSHCSCNAEISRLDAKGTKELPPRYRLNKKGPPEN